MKHLTFSDPVLVVSAGVLGGAVAEHTRRKALEHGVRLCALCGNIWPANDDGLHQIVADEVIRELTQFALYARRYMEMMDCHKEGVLQVDGPLLEVAADGVLYEKDVKTAINRILHARSMRVQFVTPDPVKHTALGDQILLHVQITSKQMATVHVCPQGLFYGFARTDLAHL